MDNCCFGFLESPKNFSGLATLGVPLESLVTTRTLMAKLLGWSGDLGEMGNHGGHDAKNPQQTSHNDNWAVLSDEQMSNWLGVEHQPDKFKHHKTPIIFRLK